MTAATTVGLYVVLTTVVAVGGTTDLLNEMPPPIGVCVVVATLLCAGDLGFHGRVRLCVMLAVGILLGWLVIADLGGSQLAAHFDETSALNGFVLVALQCFAALIGATAGRLSRDRHKGR